MGNFVGISLFSVGQISGNVLEHLLRHYRIIDPGHNTTIL